MGGLGKVAPRQTLKGLKGLKGWNIDERNSFAFGWRFANLFSAESFVAPYSMVAQSNIGLSSRVVMGRTTFISWMFCNAISMARFQTCRIKNRKQFKVLALSAI
jgi:hypothetical protein